MAVKIPVPDRRKERIKPTKEDGTGQKREDDRRCWRCTGAILLLPALPFLTLCPSPRLLTLQKRLPLLESLGENSLAFDFIHRYEPARKYGLLGLQEQG